MPWMDGQRVGQRTEMSVSRHRFICILLAKRLQLWHTASSRLHSSKRKGSPVNDSFERPRTCICNRRPIFFEDDGYHAHFLVMSLKCHWLAKSSLQATLPIMRSLREANPKMMRIWQNSGSRKEGFRNHSIKYCLDFLCQVERKISSGAIREDADITPADRVVEAL